MNEQHAIYMPLLWIISRVLNNLFVFRKDYGRTASRIMVVALGDLSQGMIWKRFAA